MSNFCKNCFELAEKLEKKEQECEELKEQLTETKTFDLFADKLIEKFNTDSAIASIFDNNTRYRKALEEIEKVINNIFNSCLGRNTVGCKPAHNVCGDLIKILDIINKAKGK